MADTVEPAGAGRYPSDMEGRVAALEQIARGTAATLARLEQRFEGVEQRFQAIDRRFDAADRRFESLERRMDLLMAEHHTDFRWLVALILGQTAAVLGVMAHGFHWL